MKTKELINKLNKFNPDGNFRTVLNFLDWDREELDGIVYAASQYDYVELHCINDFNTKGLTVKELIGQLKNADPDGNQELIFNFFDNDDEQLESGFDYISIEEDYYNNLVLVIHTQ